NYCLHCAVTNNNPDMVQLVLNNGANPAQKNKAGKTALDLLLEGTFSTADKMRILEKFKAHRVPFPDIGQYILSAIATNNLEYAKALIQYAVHIQSSPLEITGH